MKNYSKTLLELDFKLELSKTGACTSCFCHEIHGTKEFAKQAVAKHRAISKEIRKDLEYLISKLDGYDEQVEESYRKVVES